MTPPTSPSLIVCKPDTAYTNPCVWVRSIPLVARSVATTTGLGRYSEGAAQLLGRLRVEVEKIRLIAAGRVTMTLPPIKPSPVDSLAR